MSDIRRKLFSLFDLIVLLVAFLPSLSVASFLQSRLPQLRDYCQECFRFVAPNGPAPSSLPISEYIWIYCLVTPFAILALEVLGAHRPIRQQSLASVLRNGIIAPLVGTGALSMLLVVAQAPHYSRIFMVSYALMSAVALIVVRLIGLRWYHYTLKEGLHKEAIAIIGRRETAIKIAEHITANMSRDELEVAGYFPLHTPGTDDHIPSLKTIGHLQQLRQMLNQEHIQRVVVALPSGDNDWLPDVLEACEYFGITVSVIPDALVDLKLAELSPRTSDKLGQLPVLTLAPPQSQADWLYVKRVIDVLVSGTILLGLMPLMLLIAILIKITTPDLRVLHPMSYVGRGGRRFHGYKFTTMVANAHKMQDELKALNIMTGPVFKIKNDPRITPLGRIIRKFDLNELPQLWNVFKGDMSLVGPRPTSAHELQKYDLWHRRRLNIQPGVTCFWQVRGRNAISNFDDWVRMDLEYIERRSLWLDCKILARTALVVIRGTGS